MENKEEIKKIEIDSIEKSSEARILERRLKNLGKDAEINVSLGYTIQKDFSDEQLRSIASSLSNDIVHKVRINKPTNLDFDWALEIGFLPGVTDNVAATTSEIINDLLNIDIGRNKVFSSKIIFIKSKQIQKHDVENLAKDLINTLIERYHIKSYEDYKRDNGMDKVVPKVTLTEEHKVIEVNLDLSEEELIRLGKQGIIDPKTNEPRGPLALDLESLKTIRDYFKKQNRNPTDIELECLAQTWSEHCKHTIFAAEFDDIKDGIFKYYIKRATDEIRQKLGEKDFCVSVFKDNSGGIIFDDDYLITDKAETHNSPSVLDPFGGAITGIVGVNRDTIGFGRGALPVINRYGYCFGYPEDTGIIYRQKNKSNPALSPRKIMDGVVHGVNVGGNCSGIPTPQGFCCFDDRYKGKPLVFVGTVGLIPRKINNIPGHEKQAQPNDNIVVIGGRVGKDGIHGATFSSEALDSGSPATAVQIGDPITQKKLSDAVVKEALHLNLYNSITDNGAGGISCSVSEMARECGGYILDLDKVPLKYPGLQPWETWISESQERMTLAVPDNKLQQFLNLMKKRGVEAAVIGRFNSTNKAIVTSKGKNILDINMEFLHEGLPSKLIKSTYTKPQNQEPEFSIPENLNITLKQMLSQHNITSFEYISKQYDHEVQAGSIIKPLQGIGRVNSYATITRPINSSKKAIVLSQGINPRYGDIDMYQMAACAIDTAVRNAVSAGGNIDHMALMDNFCWCSSDEPERLGQLKETARACYETATAYTTPFISGKDSMFNDFKGFDENNNPIKISVPPTLLISTIGVIEDINNTISMDAKIEGDLIYVLGKTKKELGASEYYNLLNKEFIGSSIPVVETDKARELYRLFYQACRAGLIASAISINLGGLGIALAKQSIAGHLGAEINLSKLNKADDLIREDYALFSETQSRILVTIDPRKKQEFEQLFAQTDFALIGEVKGSNLIINGFNAQQIINTPVNELEESYKERFKDY